MAIVFDNSDGASDAPYHRWCKVHANGFVINTRRPFNANLAMLHRAVCRTIHYAIVAIQPNSFTGQAYMKVCSDDIGDLLNWIQKNGGKNFTSYCGTCHPLSHPGPIDDKRRRYWVLRALPHKYRVQDTVRDLIVDNWKTSGSHLSSGDRVAIWQGQDRKLKRRGIIALGEVLGPAVRISDENNPYWLNENDRHEVVDRVPIRYIQIPSPIWVNPGRDQLLDNLSVEKSQGGTAFKMSAEEWKEILKRVGDWPETTDVADSSEAILRKPVKNHSGQGIGLSIVERKVVENCAMRLAKKLL